MEQTKSLLTVLSQMQCLLILYWGDIPHECLFCVCDTDTMNRVSPATCLCEKCVNEYEIDVSRVQCFPTALFAWRKYTRMPNHLINLYCRKCIISGQCECILCTWSNDNVQQGEKEFCMEHFGGTVSSSWQLYRLWCSFTKGVRHVQEFRIVWSLFGKLKWYQIIIEQKDHRRMTVSPFSGRIYDGNGNKGVDILLMLYYTRIMIHDTGKIYIHFRWRIQGRQVSIELPSIYESLLLFHFWWESWSQVRYILQRQGLHVDLTLMVKAKIGF